MERLKELEACIREFWDEPMERKKRDMKEQRQYLEQVMCQQLHVLIKEQEKEQKEGIHEAIKYLFLCRYSSSGYTDSFDDRPHFVFFSGTCHLKVTYKPLFITSKKKSTRIAVYYK